MKKLLLVIIALLSISIGQAQEWGTLELKEGKDSIVIKEFDLYQSVMNAEVDYIFTHTAWYGDVKVFKLSFKDSTKFKALYIVSSMNTPYYILLNTPTKCWNIQANDLKQIIWVEIKLNDLMTRY